MDFIKDLNIDKVRNLAEDAWVEFVHILCISQQVDKICEKILTKLNGWSDLYLAIIPVALLSVGLDIDITERLHVCQVAGVFGSGDKYKSQFLLQLLLIH